jgi:hypothetical protein
VDAVIATGRQKHGETPPPAPRGRIPARATPCERMAVSRLHSTCCSVEERVPSTSRTARRRHEELLSRPVETLPGHEDGISYAATSFCVACAS